MLNRRSFLGTLTGGLLGAPLAAEGQQPQGGKVYRVGTLHSASPEDAAPRIAALESSLAELGYVAGRNIAFVHRYAHPQLTGVAELAAELVRAGVDVVVTATNPTTAALMKATSTVPIVMTVGVEPVSAGLVASITRPGGNVTGLTFDVDPTQVAGKRLEILKELVPSLSRAGVLWNPTYGPADLRLKGTEAAGRKLGIAVIPARVTQSGELERAFADLQRARAQALIVMSDPLTVAQRKRIVELAASHRLPAVYALREFIEAGGLASYATSLVDQYRRAARYVDRILKGARPGDLPVEQPITFELWINAKAAKAIGLTIPASLLQRADQVIE